MSAELHSRLAGPRAGYLPVENTELYYRVLGRGRPLLILHGGPDFDHSYLLPEMDRLSDSFALIYYDQRGRGRSAGRVQPQEVSLESEIRDLDKVRQGLGLESTAVLGHSWGGVLALEYALRHPRRVSHLLLMNSAPVSHADLMLFRQQRARQAPDDVAQLQALRGGAGYQAGDPDAVAAYYRVHFHATVPDPELLERIVARLKASFTPELILNGRAIEERLYDETWRRDEYDLLPKLGRLDLPALVIHGDHDLIPVECAAHIAQAIPGAHLVVLPDCGHFSFLERPEQVRKAIGDFFEGELDRAAAN